VKWRNPFSGVNSYVSFANTRFIVFWSKDPAPLLPHLSELKERGIGCYIQYTLNDYEQEVLEPCVPKLEQRIDTFKRLVDALGVGSVVWRFDPLILTDQISIHTLLQRISNIAEQLNGYTEKLVFSYADIESYGKVARNLRNLGVNYMEWTESLMLDFAKRLSEMNKRWGYQLATCAERIPLEQWDIAHNRCIDPDLISRLTDDIELKNHLYGAKKDSGQRKLCGCIAAKDIGSYNTCPHGCKYCYANTYPAAAAANYRTHCLNPQSDTIIG
jgi:DNA repair photolyase